METTCCSVVNLLCDKEDTSVLLMNQMIQRIHPTHVREAYGMSVQNGTPVWESKALNDVLPYNVEHVLCSGTAPVAILGSRVMGFERMMAIYRDDLFYIYSLQQGFTLELFVRIVHDSIMEPFIQMQENSSVPFRITWIYTAPPHAYAINAVDNNVYTKAECDLVYTLNEEEHCVSFPCILSSITDTCVLPSELQSLLPFGSHQLSIYQLPITSIIYSDYVFLPILSWSCIENLLHAYWLDYYEDLLTHEIEKHNCISTEEAKQILFDIFDVELVQSNIKICYPLLRIGGNTICFGHFFSRLFRLDSSTELLVCCTSREDKNNSFLCSLVFAKSAGDASNFVIWRQK